jgi:alanine-synthesizing transaminase
MVDEVFLDYPLRELAPTPRSFAVGEHPALIFVLSGVSKIVGLPQMKAAWIATLGPEGARSEALSRLEIVADTFLSMNAPVQLALPRWLAGRKAIQAEIRGRARQNLELLETIARGSPELLHVLRVDAGWSAVLALPRCVGELDCADRLVRERRVLTHPGCFYGIGGKNRVVVSLIGDSVAFKSSILRATSAHLAVENVQVTHEQK